MSDEKKIRIVKGVREGDSKSDHVSKKASLDGITKLNPSGSKAKPTKGAGTEPGGAKVPSEDGGESK